MNDRITIKSLELLNWRSIGRLEIDCGDGKFVAVTGPNGAGKSSVVEAVSSLFEGGSKPEVIGPQDRKARVVAVLSNGVTIDRTVTAGGSTVKLSGPDGKEIKSPQRHLNEWIDRVSFSPIALLGAKPKDRVTAIVETLPLELPEAELSEIFGGQTVPVRLDQHPLHVINEARGVFYERRTVANGEARTQRAHAKELREALPPDAADPEAAAETLRGAQAEEARLKEEREERMAKINRLSFEETEEIRRRVNAEREAILRAAEKEVDRIRGLAQAEIDSVRARKDDQSSQVIEELDPKIEEAVSRAAAAAEAQRVAERSTGLRTAIERAEATATAREKESAALTRTIDRLDQLSVSLLDQSPVPGLSLDGGDVAYHGRPWDKLNTAAKAELVLAIAKLRAREVGVICLDGFELCDRALREAIREQAERDGVQLFTATVTDTERLEVAVT